MKVLILADTPGWIVDRITDEMIRLMPYEFIKRYYTQISTKELMNLAKEVDIVHYQNWDLQYHLPKLLEIEHLLVSCRSFRFPQYFKDLAPMLTLHVINPLQLEYFPNATYIPDGIFNFRKLRVGFVGRADVYKGFHLIEQACRDIDAEFKPALNIKPDKMLEYYDSVDVVVIASENEGHNTIAMECLALNKPVITTPVGLGGFIADEHIERSVESIKQALLKKYTRLKVDTFSWEKVCKEFQYLYESINKRNKG